MARFTLATATEQGTERSVNQDRVHAQMCGDTVALAIIADGLGSYAASAEASATACQIIMDTIGGAAAGSEKLPGRRALVDAINAANLALWQRALDTQIALKTTLTVLMCTPSVAFVGHVGDCRVYLTRAGTTRQVTRDHSLSGSRPFGWLGNPLRRLAPTAHASTRHVLHRVLGDHPIVKVDIDEIALQSGDRFVLCCDGVWGALTEDVMLAALLRSPMPDDEHAKYLIALARTYGSTDDASTITMQVDEIAV